MNREHRSCAGLLCLKTAKSGGESSWSSSVSVHNELLRLGRADLVEALAGDWWVDRKVRRFGSSGRERCCYGLLWRGGA